MFQRTRRRIAKIVEDYNNTEVRISSLIPGLSEIFEKKNSFLHRLLWISILVAAFSCLTFQVCDKIVHYLEKPVKVRADFVDNRHDFPAIFVHVFETDDWLENMENENEKFDVCGVIPSFRKDKRSSIFDVWRLSNSTKQLEYVVFKQGTEISKTKIKITTLATLFGETIKMTAVQGLQWDSTAKIELLVKSKRPGRPLATLVYFAAAGINNVFLVVDNFQYAFTGSTGEFALTVRKYKFLNKKGNPCTSVEAMDQCHYNRFEKLTRDSVTCQLPFMTKRYDNECPANQQTCDSLEEMAVIRNKINPHYDCFCPRECERTMTISYFNSIFLGEKPVFTIYPISDDIQILSEYFYYDITSLFCDIGGFLGFYVGLSCLSLVDLGFCFIQKRYKKRMFFQRYGDNRIADKVKAILSKKQTFFTQTTNVSVSVMFLKKLIIGISFCICLYTMYLKISFYYIYPTYTTIEVIEENVLNMPPLVICSESEDIYNAKKDLKDRLNLNVECTTDVDTDDLLDMSPTFKHNPEKYWTSMMDIEPYRLLEGVDVPTDFLEFRTANLSVYPTMFGDCMKLIFDEVKYNPVTSAVFLARDLTDGDCNQLYKWKVFFLDEGNVDYNTYLTNSFYGNVNIFQMKFVKQQVMRLNTPTNPCDTLTSNKKCKEECKIKRFTQKKVKCRLPHMKISGIPLCKTSKEVKSVRTAYLTAFTNNSCEDCKCLPPCIETIFIPSIEVAISYIGFVVARFLLESNSYEIFKQERQLPISKLVCDIGSLVAFFLGLSVLLILKNCNNFLIYCRTRKIKNSVK